MASAEFERTQSLTTDERVFILEGVLESDNINLQLIKTDKKLQAKVIKKLATKGYEPLLFNDAFKKILSREN